MMLGQMVVGRQEEQRALDALVAGARLGQSGVVVLSGEPGIGKTTLLEYAVARATGISLLRARGTDTERDLPFAGLAQLLRPIADRIDGLPAPQAEALSVALALRPGPTPDRFAVSAGVLGLVTAAAEEGPLGLVVDDGHLVDRPSAEALMFTCRRLLADSVFAVVATRNEPGSPWVTSELPRLRLLGLAPAPAADLVAESTPHVLPADVVDRVVGLARGNPLALRELARDPGALVVAGPGIPVTIPAVVAAVYERRLAPVTPGDRSVLLAVAVAQGDLALVARACAAAGLDLTAVERAEQAGLLRTAPDRVADFTHPLLRAAVYATAAPAERRRMHRLVGDAVPAADPDRRAWHHAAATLGPDAEVAAALEAVGHAASARGAHAVASGALERASDLSTDDAERAHRCLAAGAAAWLAGDGEGARRLAAAARGLDTAPALVLRAQALEGLVAARSGHLRRGVDLLLTVARAAEHQDMDVALTAYADAVDACFTLLDVPGAERAADRVERLLSRRGDLASAGASAGAMPGVVGLALVAVGVARILAGKEGVEPLRQGVARLTAEGGPPGRQSDWEVLGPLFLRDSETGRELVEQAVAGRRNSAAIGTLPHLLFQAARDDATTERWAQAEAGYGEAVALARELGQVMDLGAALAGLTWLSARQGRVAEAEATAKESRALTEAHELHRDAAWVRFALAELELSRGHPASAAADFADLVGWLEGLGVLDVDLTPVPELVEASLRAGRPVPQGPVERYLARATAKGQPWSLARAARVRGLLAEADDLDAPFEEALAWHAQTLDRFEVARTRLLYGERLRRARRRVDARNQLRPALTEFERLGATLWADAAAAELDATGISVHRRETGPVVDLTPRELQIALLLAGGKTTRETAAALFLSPKTVEYHLRHVYTKLDVGSRSELAVLMHEHR